MLLLESTKIWFVFFQIQKTQSIVLMAVVNSNYQHIGDARRQNDGGVFAASTIGQALGKGLLNIPPPKRLYGDTKLFPFVWSLTKKYSFERIFNKTVCKGIY